METGAGRLKGRKSGPGGNPVSFSDVENPRQPKRKRRKQTQLPSVLIRELELWFDCLNSTRFGWWLHYSPFTDFLSSPAFPKLVFDGESITLTFLFKTNQPECVTGLLTATCKEARVNHGRT